MEKFKIINLTETVNQFGNRKVNIKKHIQEDFKTVLKMDLEYQ